MKWQWFQWKRYLTKGDGLQQGEDIYMKMFKTKRSRSHKRLNKI